VLTGLLREELGFDGLIVTDALVMEAIAGRYGAGEAAVLALEAGADLVLMPADANAALDAIAAAVASGRLSQAQLERSAERRRQALADGSLAGHASDLPSMHAAEHAAEPDQALALELVQATLQRQGPASERALQPEGSAGVNLIRCDNVLAAPFLPLTAPAVELPEARGYRTCLLEARSPSPWSGDLDAPLDLTRLPPGPVLLQLFVRGNPFRGSAGASEPWPQAIRQLRQVHRLAGVVVYGSPYLWESLQPELTAEPALAAVYSPGQMPMAQAEALQQLGFGANATATGFTD
jgi:beta-glucosidase